MNYGISFFNWDTGLKGSCLDIAQVKAKHGIIERYCYNKSKTEGIRVPKCPPEKERASPGKARARYQMPVSSSTPGYATVSDFKTSMPSCLAGSMSVVSP